MPLSPISLAFEKSKKEKKECTAEHLAWALDLNKSQIQYYKAINSRSAVSGYVLKNMKADQIHYNFY